MNRHDRHDRRAQASKQPKHWLRSFTDPDLSVVLCRRHMKDALDVDLGRAAGIGEALKLTKEVAARCGASFILPADLTDDEELHWAEHFTRFWLWQTDFTCEVCGHIARGELTQSTDEERVGWQRQLDEEDIDARTGVQ